jgi:hypothetical protein
VLGQTPEGPHAQDTFREDWPGAESPAVTERDGAPPALLPRIPGYEVLGVPGQGGMGIVSQARQVKANRLVALKMIRSGALAGPAELMRFRRDAEAGARLRHPGIVQVYEVGEHDGLPFFSLEFCAGGSLEQKLRDNLLPAREAALLVLQVTRAMAAHKQGVLHRDLPGGAVVQTLPHLRGVEAVAWHPGGRLLATGEGKDIHLWDAQTGKPQADLQGHSWDVDDLTFDRDGDRLLSFGWDMTVRLWDVWTRRELLTLGEVWAVSFSRDGPLRTAVLRGRQVQLWECVASSECRVLHGPEHNLYSVAFSPDARWLAAAGSVGSKLWFWDAVTGRQVARVEQPNTLGFVWEPAGDALITYSGRYGLQGWPIRPLGREEPPDIQIGPPRLLAPSADPNDGGASVCRCGPGKKWLGVTGYHDESFSLLQTDPRPGKSGNSTTRGSRS